MIRSVERQGTARAADGRTLAFVERGAEGGVPILVSHGTPGSRFTRHPDPGLYERLGARMVVYDRPGYGGAHPPPRRPVGGAVGGIPAIPGELGVEPFAR